MKKLLVPILVFIVLVQFVMLWLTGSDQTSFPRVFVQEDSYVVQIVDEDMQDDAVRAVKYRLELVSDEFGLRDIVSQDTTWACWPGRGNENFGEEWCE